MTRLPDFLKTDRIVLPWLIAVGHFIYKPFSMYSFSMYFLFSRTKKVFQANICILLNHLLLAVRLTLYLGLIRRNISAGIVPDLFNKIWPNLPFLFLLKMSNVTFLRSIEMKHCAKRCSKLVITVQNNFGYAPQRRI